MPEGRKSGKQSSLVVFSGTLDVKKAEKSFLVVFVGSGGAFLDSAGAPVWTGCSVWLLGGGMVA